MCLESRINECVGISTGRLAPSRESATRCFGVATSFISHLCQPYIEICSHIRARTRNQVQAGLLCRFDERTQVAEAGKVDPGTAFWLVHAFACESEHEDLVHVNSRRTPKSVEGDSVKPEGLDFLENVEVKGLHGHPVISRCQWTLLKCAGRLTDRDGLHQRRCVDVHH
jgi:hypothetical protein